MLINIFKLAGKPDKEQKEFKNNMIAINKFNSYIDDMVLDSMFNINSPRKRDWNEIAKDVINKSTGLNPSLEELTLIYNLARKHYYHGFKNNKNNDLKEKVPHLIKFITPTLEQDWHPEHTIPEDYY